jgi:subtilisin family serine protease
MGKIDPRLTFYGRLQPKKRLSVASNVHFMAAMSEPKANEIPETRMQVFIQVRNPEQELRIPGVYIRSRIGNIFTAQFTPGSLSSLEADSNIVYVERGAPLEIEQTSQSSETNKIEIPSGPLDETGQGVIVGIVDQGCDFTHGDFRDESGSRILYFWDQTANPGPQQDSPDGYNIGVEYTKSQLDQALSQSDPFATLGIDPPEPAAHGTHVMGIAAGNGREDPTAGVQGLAHKADIIFVEPNTSDTSDVGGFGDSINLAEAIKYIVDKASALNCPAVINVSLGTNHGPHDGTTLAERSIDSMLDEPGRAVVLALGNEHDERFLRPHAEGRLSTGETTTLYWRVLPTDYTPNEVEIWYSSRDIFVLEVVLPNGETVPIVEPGQEASFNVGDAGTEVFVSNELNHHYNGDNHIDVIVLPGSQTPVETGVWQLRLTSRLSREGTFDAWIERDVRSPRINPQSSFIGGSYVRRKTLGGIQSSYHAITVSNYDAMTITLSDSTSVGPTRDGRRAPVVAAPGVDILSANARYHAAQDRGDRTPYIRMNGTSMSSPYVAGIVACMLQKNPDLTAGQIKGLIAANAKAAPGISYEYRNDWGYGRADPVETLAATPPGRKSNP